MNEVKNISNTFLVKTLKEAKVSKKVVSRIMKLTEQQKNVLFWELIADKVRIIREDAMLSLITEVEENV